MKVVLLHGLHDRRADPFTDLLPLESELRACGYAVELFRWPRGFDGARALYDRKRSFADELARAFDEFLRGIPQAELGDGWAAIGHSGGGLTLYRWLTAYRAGFAESGGRLPELVGHLPCF